MCISTDEIIDSLIIRDRQIAQGAKLKESLSESMCKEVFKCNSKDL